MSRILIVEDENQIRILGLELGEGAITFATDNNGDSIKEDATINEEITNKEENYINENPYVHTIEDYESSFLLFMKL